MKFRTRVPVVLLGEKDHGKSTLIGRLLFETRSIPEKRYREAKRASASLGKKFEWAHLVDSFRIEREKGMTLDTTRALITLSTNEYEFIDVPGHAELIKNFLTGASAARCGIAVIAADDGITSQTKRHLALAHFFRLRRLIVVVNKMDLVRYSRDRFLKHAKEVRDILRELKVRNVQIVPIAAKRGSNLIIKDKNLAWFKGPTLRDALLTSAEKARPRSRIFVIAVQGTYDKDTIVGRLVSGSIKRGSHATLFPGRTRMRVVRTISRGSKDIVFKVDSLRTVSRGDVLTNSNNKVLKNEFTAECVFLQKVPTQRNVVLEAHFKETDVRKMRSVHEIFGVHTIKISLAASALVTGTFVLKKNGVIIGLGRTH